jgi:hypothetical protein
MGMWTLDELVDRARAALAAEYPGAPNGRVRELPDRRSIRWYTQTGLVDRPLGMRGRTALYGPRHLLQLVALKRRQAAGSTLAQIQAELTGATDAELSAIARVPDRLLTLSDAYPPADPATPRPRFWAAPAAVPDAPPVPAATAAAPPPTDPALAAPPPTDPALAAPPSTDPDLAAPPSRGGKRYARVPDRSPRTSDAAPADGGAGRAVGGVALGGGAILVLPTTPTPADVAAVTAAAGPLITLLAERGLLTTEDRDPGRL